MRFPTINRSVLNIYFVCVVVVVLFIMHYGCNNGKHASLITEIQTDTLVPGNSHSGLWLGPGMFFKPGDPPHNFHIFISKSDRKGGDSVQRRNYFTVDSIPAKGEDFSEWWKKWEKQPFPAELTSRYDNDGYEWVPGFTWKYHRQSDKWLGIGVLLRHKDKQLSNHLEHLEITYSVYDGNTNSFSDWKSFRINIDGQENPCVAYGQRVDLPNGDILLPFATIKELSGWNSIRWCGAAYCVFDGKKLKSVKVSELFTNPVPRGFVEPSMAFYNGHYFMTLRAQDGFGHVATSTDGMNWSEPQPWRWDDGTPIDMNQTMTRFISHSDGLFLVYTRITQDNDNVFRNRAPLFIARINTKTKSLFRNSEKIIFPNKGMPIGNFHVYNVSPRESWVAVPEWDRTGKDIPCDILLGRIIWDRRNRNIK